MSLGFFDSIPYENNRIKKRKIQSLLSDLH